MRPSNLQWTSLLGDARRYISTASPAVSANNGTSKEAPASPATDDDAGPNKTEPPPKPGQEDGPWYKQAWAAPILHLFATVLVVMGSFVVNYYTEKKELAAVAVGVEQRLLDGIKARILQPVRPPLFQPPQAGVASVCRRIRPLQRPAASELFKQLEREYPIDIVIAPKGHGKSTAARTFACDPANPHAIYVDLHGCNTYDDATRRVADALGYRMVYTAEEQRAKESRYGIKDLDGTWGAKELDYVLRLFMRACGELLAAGMLKDGRPPMLLLDHASRPFGVVKRAVAPLDAPPAVPPDLPSRLDDTLIYQTLESTKTSDLAANRQCRFVFITSDTTAERDSWEKSGARDTFNYRVLPPFTTDEASELLAHYVYFNCHPSASSAEHPPPAAVAAIKTAYASTFAFLIAALGPRARTLALAIDSLHGQPLVPDADLLTKGVSIPEALLPFLSPTLPATVATALATSTGQSAATKDAPAVRVDANALLKVEAWVKQQKRLIEEMLFLPPDIVLLSPQPTDSQRRAVRRVLDVDAGLRALLAVGSLSEVDFEFVLGSSKHLAPVLAEKHLVFYNLETKDVEFESEAVKQVIRGMLDSEPHQAQLQLARAVLEWQKVSQVPRSIWGVIGDALGLRASQGAAARARVEQAAAALEQLARLRPLGVKA